MIFQKGSAVKRGVFGVTCGLDLAYQELSKTNYIGPEYKLQEEWERTI
jgi:hypothetical protein